MGKLFYAFAYIKYFLTAGHINGNAIHSPFLFRQVNVLFAEGKPYYCYSKIEKLRRAMRNDKRTVWHEDFGTGVSANRKISSLAKTSLKSLRDAQLLFRLANDAGAKHILELGTSLGITTAYLASVNSQADCHTIEGAKQIAEIAAQNFRKLYLNNITTHVGNISDLLPEVLCAMKTVDFVFFDANHTKEATLYYFRQCLPYAVPNAVFVFDDIHRSCEMEQAWKEIQLDEKVRISVDIFSMGIVYLDAKLQKENYIVRF